MRRRTRRQAAGNPRGRFIRTPDFRYQLFIPRHETEWKGLPKKVKLDPSPPGGGSNKPGGAFWTSTLGGDGFPTSDWDQWMRIEMPQWIIPRGIVLEVVNNANVRHLSTVAEAQAFLEAYGQPGPTAAIVRRPEWRKGLFEMFEVVPNWEQVAHDYDGLHLEGGALSHPAFYGWDAESTAWFTTRPLRVMRKIELETPPKRWSEEEDNPRRRPKRSSGGAARSEQERHKNPHMKVDGLDVETDYDPGPRTWFYRIRLGDEELWTDHGFRDEHEAIKEAIEAIANHVPDAQHLREGHFPFREPDYEAHNYALWEGPGSVTEVDGECVSEYREMDDPDDEGRWWMKATNCPYPSPLSIRLRAGVGVDNLAHWGDSEAHFVEDNEVPTIPKTNPRKKSRRPQKRARSRALFRRLMRL